MYPGIFSCGSQNVKIFLLFNISLGSWLIYESFWYIKNKTRNNEKIYSILFLFFIRTDKILFILIIKFITIIGNFYIIFI